MDQALDQQDVLIANVGIVAEKDFEKALGSALFFPAISRLNELTDNRGLESAHQISHEHEAILQQGERMNGIALIVVGDLPRDLTYPLLNLLGGDHGSKLLGFGDGIHEWRTIF